MNSITRTGLVIAVLACAAMAPGEVVTLQRDLDGYTGVGDVYLNSNPSGASSYGYGASVEGYTYSSSESEMVLVQFDLSGISATSVNSAKLYLYCSEDRYGGATRAKQVGMSWDEGTNDHYNGLIDGCGHRNRHQPIATDFDLEPGQGWVLQGGGSYKLDLDKPLAACPRHASDAMWRYIRRGRTNEGGRIRGYDWTRDYGTAHASLAALEAAAPVSGQDKFLYYWDSASNDLYARVDSDANAPTRINFLYEEDTWTYSTRLAAGYWEGDFTLENGDPLPAASGEPNEDVWHVLEATQIVRRWLGGLDGEPAADNHGLQVDAIYSSSNGRDYFMSEVSGMYDPINREFEGGANYDPNNAVDSATLRPKLVIDYVPEPATLGLLGLGLVGFAIRRRRR